jgi:hypothetical protein
MTDRIEEYGLLMKEKEQGEEDPQIISIWLYVFQLIEAAWRVGIDEGVICMFDCLREFII